MKIINVNFNKILLYLIILLPYIGVFFIYNWYKNKVYDIENANFILISKQDMNLTLYDYKGKVLKRYPIALGSNFGDKSSIGDKKTPEGVFFISNIEDSSSWDHDFNDGKGDIIGAYGPFFIRLEVPNAKGIGIHGTHDTNSIGKRVTEGCIRLKNEDVVELSKLVKRGSVVAITTSDDDVKKNE
jgi:lipoprotein-anchoring transpeptidase ErfK/SrfK